MISILASRYSRPFPNHLLPSNQESLLRESNAFFSEHTHLIFAFRGSFRLETPFTAEPADKVVGCDDAVAGDEGGEGVVAHRVAHCCNRKMSLITTE